MISLPIGDRELRIGSRSSSFYRSRRNIAGVALALFFGLYLVFGAMPAGGRYIFNILSNLSFIYALGVGIVLTADSISSERRSGTLGLLFLTGLKPYDVAAGNILATALKAFYGLLAAFPILGIGMTLGGVSYGEFGRVCLALVSALFLSLTFSLLVSCLNVRHLAATSFSVIGLFIFSVIWPTACEGVKRGFAFWPAAVDVARSLELLSPSTTLNLAGAVGGRRLSEYWISLACVNVFSVLFFVLACLAIRYAWRDRVTVARRRSAPERRQRNTRSRARILQWNPFYWLASRDSAESTKFLLITLTLAILAVVFGQWAGPRVVGGRHPLFGGILFGWVWLTGLVHAAMLYKVAALASQRLAEDRKSGAMELLLVTPLKVGQILRGQWLALLRQLGGPALAAAVIYGILLWGMLSMFSLEDEIAGGVIGVLMGLWEVVHSDEWQMFPRLGPTLATTGVGIILVMDWFALAWVGMWVGLRTRRSALAVWITLGIVLVPPAVLFGVMVVPAHMLGFSQNMNFWFTYCLTIGLSILSLNAIFLIGFFWRKLAREFRAAATDRFQKSDSEIRPVIALRYAAIVAAPFLLVWLLYAEENWRGRRAWSQLQADFTAKGLELRTSPPLPPLIDASENFGAADIFKPFFAYTRNQQGAATTWHRTKDRQRLMSINVCGDAQKPGAYSQWLGDWRLGRATDLNAWQQFYRTNKTVSATNEVAARAIIGALSEFDPEMDEIEKVSRLPKARFPVHYHEGIGAFVMHRSFLMNVSELLQLRAVAHLDLGENEAALCDMEFAYRLSRATELEPGLHARLIQRRMVMGTLQVVWEGLARRRWSEADLRRIEKNLQCDFLAEYPRGVREEFQMISDFWNVFFSAQDPNGWMSQVAPGFRRLGKVYPLGWKQLNQAGMIRLGEEDFLPAVDVANGRVFKAKEDQLLAAIKRAGVKWDPLYNWLTGPPGLTNLAEVPLHFAFAQAQVNLALTACELERWRIAQGEFPERLDQMEAATLKKDPVTGDALHYGKISKDRFVLYSVGWNEKDDAGLTANKSTVAPGTKRTKILEINVREGDWVWSYPE